MRAAAPEAKHSHLGAWAACLWPSGCARMHWLQPLHELAPHVRNRSSRLQLRVRPHKRRHWFSLEGLFVLWDHQQKAGVKPAAPEAPGAEDSSSHKHHHKHHGKGESGDAYIKVCEE